MIADAARRKRQRSVIIALIIFCIAMNVAAYPSPRFSGWYMREIFPEISSVFARLTSLLPFSLGEVLIIIALVGVPLSLIALIVLLIAKRKSRDSRRKIGPVYAYIYE